MRIRHLALGVVSLASLIGCASTSTIPVSMEPSADDAAPAAKSDDPALQTPLSAVELTAANVTIERLQEHPDAQVDGETSDGDAEDSLSASEETDADAGTSTDTGDEAALVATLPFPDQMKTCPRMTIHNRPEEDAEARITVYHKIAVINTVPIALAPLTQGCFSSGFGYRGERLHKGTDYYYSDATEIMAAGSGTIAEALYRDDYGRMILIDHGHGVFTRYAHLESFAEEIEIGVPIKAGQIIGIMGNTASYPIPRHLHYEVLVGNYDTPKKSFGLDAIDIYTH